MNERDVFGFLKIKGKSRFGENLQVVEEKGVHANLLHAGVTCEIEGEEFKGILIDYC